MRTRVRAVRLHALLAASLACTSCIAVGVVVPGREDVSPERYSLARTGARPTREVMRERLAARGQVPEVTRDGARETWWVEHSHRFCGVVVVLPVLLPVCRSHDLYRFEDDELVFHSVGTPDFHGIICSGSSRSGGVEITVDGRSHRCHIE